MVPGFFIFSRNAEQRKIRQNYDTFTKTSSAWGKGGCHGTADVKGKGNGMSQYEKLLFAILSGTKDKNLLFSDLETLLDRLGFRCRTKGDHFIYTKDGVEEIINLQPAGNQAKPYQVKQVRNIILKYQLGGDLHEV